MALLPKGDLGRGVGASSATAPLVRGLPRTHGARILWQVSAALR